MQTSLMKTVAVGALISASVAFGASSEKKSSWPRWPTPSKTPAKETTKRVMFESLKGASEKTQLPDTARSDDARGGIRI
jgi:hypothetical protein